MTLTPPVKTPERRGGFGDPPPWAADQNTVRIDIDLTEPAATSSPKRPSPQLTRRQITHNGERKPHRKVRHIKLMLLKTLNM